MTNYNFTLPGNLGHYRLDKALFILTSEASRNKIQHAIKDGKVKVNDLIISDSSFKVKENDIISIILEQPKAAEMLGADINLDIVYEDQDLIVINKQAGLTVHPGANNYQDTLSNALLFYSDSLSDIGGLERPGIVHRLDKDTSGLMVVAKNNFAHESLAAQITTRQLARKYKALVWGVVNPQAGIIKNNIARSNHNRKKMTIVASGGKEAITHYNTAEILLNGLISMVECKLETGRTHQIRVQLSKQGNSVVGDQVYGNNNRKINNCSQLLHSEELQLKLNLFRRQALHSYYISFTHPITMEFLEFTIELPQDMLNLLEAIKKVP
jgi:23S rRNA pseudouridine1911/1915/1917 synthase